MNKKWRIVALAAFLLAQPLLTAPAGAEGQQITEQQDKYFKEAQRTDEQIRNVMHQMREESKALRKLVDQSSDPKLKEQVKTDLRGFHDKRRGAHHLYREGQELTKQAQAARHSGDLAKLRELGPQVAANKTRQLEAITAAYQELQAVHKKIQGKTR